MAYTRDGIEYPSVTTILGLLDKPALLGWAARCAVEYLEDNIDALRDTDNVHNGEQALEEAKKAYRIKRDKAADSGTLAHKAAELYISERKEQGEDYRISENVYNIIKNDEAAQNGFDAFLEWVDTNEVIFLESEVEVVSLLHGYAGRFDIIASVNGHRTLIDIKTSSGIYDEMKYQLCAYRQAYNEDKATEDIDRIAILHLDKVTGEPTYKPVLKGVTRYTELFNVLCQAYYLMKNRRLKNNPFVEYCKTIDHPIKVDL